MTDDAAENAAESAAQDKLARYMARPHAEDVAAQTRRASQAAKGLKCPKCQCQNFRVLSTRPGEDSKNRRRVCRSCGYVFHTCEFVTSDLMPDSILDKLIKELHR
jgi:hypothetical protein